ncbi:MAG: alpha/beta hydrolase [Acidobacteriaceae bacterium]|nr:alpha/beta hydrolase [Acidobacteriaceae bacterium]
MDQFTHRTEIVNGVAIHYVIGGQGEPVVLWHGFLETWYHWRKVMPALADSYTVLAFDMRGFGDSGKPKDAYQLQTLADDCRELVSHLGFRRVHLVAHDMGAPPALLYASQHPEQVRSLTYLDEPVVLDSALQNLFRFAPDTLQMGGLWWWTFALAPGMAEQLIAGHEREFLSWFYQHYCVDPGSISPDAVDEYLRTFAAPDGVTGAFGVYRCIFDWIAQTNPLRDKKVTVPVLGLGGEKSMGARVAEMLREVAVDVRGGAVPGCGHFVAEEQPEYLLDQLRQLFASTA